MAWDDLIGQADAIATMRAAAGGDGLTHSWLITGPPGSGRSTLAYAFAAALLSRPGDGADAFLDDRELRFVADLGRQRLVHAPDKLLQARLVPNVAQVDLRRRQETGHPFSIQSPHDAGRGPHHFGVAALCRFE